MKLENVRTSLESKFNMSKSLNSADARVPTTGTCGRIGSGPRYEAKCRLRLSIVLEKSCGRWVETLTSAMEFRIDSRSGLREECCGFAACSWIFLLRSSKKMSEDGRKHSIHRRL